jgi:hypothetical protein
MRHKQTGICPECKTVQEKELISGLCAFHHHLKTVRQQREKYKRKVIDKWKAA